MSETSMRREVVRMLYALDAFSVENPVWPGTPDVNYQEGWIELKQLARWPVREGIVKIEHYTKQQRYFHRQRWRNGGNVFLLLKVGREWLLFDGDVAAKEIGHRTAHELKMLARAYWTGGLPREALIRCLAR